MLSRLKLRHRIPEVPHYTSPASVKWASLLFWNVLNPLLHLHHRYFRRKVQLDRLLEKQHFMVNAGLAFLGGLTVYFGVLHHLFPSTIPSDEAYSFVDDSRQVLALMMGEASNTKAEGKELPAFQLMKVKGDIMGRMHAAADVSEMMLQESQVKALQAAAAAGG